MISNKESKQVSMDCWLLKLLSRYIETKTKNKDQRTSNHKNYRKIKSNRKVKAMGEKHLPWTTIPERDRWEIPILNLVCHVSPGNE